MMFHAMFIRKLKYMIVFIYLGLLDTVKKYVKPGAEFFFKIGTVNFCAIATDDNSQPFRLHSDIKGKECIKVIPANGISHPSRSRHSGLCCDNCYSAYNNRNVRRIRSNASSIASKILENGIGTLFDNKDHGVSFRTISELPRNLADTLLFNLIRAELERNQMNNFFSSVSTNDPMSSVENSQQFESNIDIDCDDEDDDDDDDDDHDYEVDDIDMNRVI